ncbi:glycosyltransferase [Pedobacter ghigonis]|uniref:glycosyltransferase n=1 Tax=Pedobacter ghigonis TaxID=2730403 RepID=UPI00158C01F9|nr:glycosyltransferase [Pedobacter ghigonis]
MSTNHRQFQVISLTDEPNGAEQVLLKMAVAINGELTFLKRNKGSRLVIPSNIASRFLSNTNILIGLLKLVVLIRAFKRDEVVMSTHPYLNAYLGFFKRMGWLRSKLVVRECTSVFTRFSGFKKYLYSLIYKLGYPGADLIICQTDLMKEQLLEHNRFINERKTLVQPNPVDLPTLFEQAKNTITLEENELQFICAAGRLIPEKGFDILIKAFSIVHRNYPDLKLLILGEGRELDKLLELVKELNLTNSVIFKGHIANPMPYYRIAKLCVVSSIKEGFPNTLLEMMALNKAIVTTFCAGGIDAIPDISKVPIENVDALANAMLNTIANSNLAPGEAVRAYLEQRSPKIFAQSLLQAI